MSGCVAKQAVSQIHQVGARGGFQIALMSVIAQLQRHDGVLVFTQHGEEVCGVGARGPASSRRRRLPGP